MARELGPTLLREVDPARAIVRPFDGFLLVCGGPLEPKSAGKLASVRHFAIMRSGEAGDLLAACRVVVAERATELLRDGNFIDLLEFEEHLAALAACVLIFVESPGSIAELGCFSVMPHLRSKVLVVCEQRHAIEENSFIFLGPISSLRRNDAESVRVFPLLIEQDGELHPSDTLITECWEDIATSIDAFVSRPVRESRFDSSRLGHRLILIAELVSMFGALRKGELSDCIEAFGYKFAPRGLECCLKVLGKFGLIWPREWGNERFYMRADDKALMSMHRAHGDNRPFDRLRFKFERSEEYQKADRTKAKALRAFQRELTSR